MNYVRRRLVSLLMHLYPFYTGCGTVANKPLVKALAGHSEELDWARIEGGQRLRVPLSDYVGRALFLVGSLDRKISWVCRRIARPGDTVLDVGANLGWISSICASAVGESGRVHAFEPNPILCDLIEQSIARNELTNVTLHPYALGAERDELTLCVPGHNYGGGTLRRDGDAGKAASVKVEVKPLTEAVELTDPVRLMKLDVEGFDIEVLRGASNMFEQIPPTAVLFEVERGVPLTDQTPVQMLGDWGYEFIGLVPAKLRMRCESLRGALSTCWRTNDRPAVQESSFDEIASLVRAN